jgi:hypothetical protein
VRGEAGDFCGRAEAEAEEAEAEAEAEAEEEEEEAEGEEEEGEEAAAAAGIEERTSACCCQGEEIAPAVRHVLILSRASRPSSRIGEQKQKSIAIPSLGIQPFLAHIVFASFLITPTISPHPRAISPSRGLIPFFLLRTASICTHALCLSSGSSQSICSTTVKLLHFQFSFFFQGQIFL